MNKEGNAERLRRLKNIVLSLPERPGSYQYYDADGTIIYVGKAKNLKRRVSSYFNKDGLNRKTQMLVSKIHDIKYIVVETETDALLLENNLIKRYQPRYNILLKDDKTYPSICVTREPFPRILKTRNIDLKTGQYFGPYSHEPTMYALLELLDQMYHPRRCKLRLTEESIRAGKHKVCLDYHMRRCDGVCVGELSAADYQRKIDECREILKGNLGSVLGKMRDEMKDLAAEMKFEQAQIIKTRYDKLANYQATSQIVHPSNHNLDVFAIETDENNAYINYLHVTNGYIVQAFTFELKKKLGESREELLQFGIVEMRKRFGSEAKEIIVPFPVDIPDDEISQTIPQRGDKRKLLGLSELNVKQYKFDRLKQAEKLNPEQRTTRLLTEIKEHLHLPHLPMRIELFDNSNISGDDAVAACVVFDRLKPAKSQYRRYNIKTVVGPNDYASMQEVVTRRYTRLMAEDKPLPDLIITDGGAGQMGCVKEALDLIGADIPIAGLAKDNHHRTNELLYGFPPKTIGMKPTSELFLLLTRMQDEVHRFAITFHKEKRRKRLISSELDSVAGLGQVTKMQLLKAFKSVKRIREASETDLIALLGPKRGSTIYKNLHTND